MENEPTTGATPAVMTRAEAKALGLTQYPSAKPCKRNHIGPRYTCTGGCIECLKVDKSKETIEISAREKARISKDLYYFTGKPCKHGHLALRDTASATCTTCRAITVKNREPEPVKIKQKRASEYYSKNAEKIKGRARQWVEENWERSKQIKAKHCAKDPKHQTGIKKRWKEENLERHRQNDIRYREENKPRLNAKKRLREKRVVQATPPWADLHAIEAIYLEAARLTKLTGIVYHVDHVIPLCGTNISGLHVENNLKPIPAKENLSKNNFFNSEEYVHYV